MPRSSVAPRPRDVAAARLRRASKGAVRRSVILGWIACIGERVRPAPPSLDSWARDRWELARLTTLHRQLDGIRERRSKATLEGIAMRDHGATIANEAARADRERRDREIRARAARGEAVRDIARAMKCSVMTVRRACGRCRTGS